MQAWEELEYAKDDAREEEKKKFLRYLLREDKSDSEIMEIVGCEQTLIDKVRGENSMN